MVKNMKKEYSIKYLQINRNKGVVFDSSDTPFTTVRPDLSDLSENPRLRDSLRSRFPMLTFYQGCVVDGAILIQDISTSELTSQRVRSLNKTSLITLQVVDAKSVSNRLSKLLDLDPVATKDSLMVFPGEGARTMYQFINNQQDTQEAIFLPTKRTMIKSGEFYLDVDYSSLPVETNKSRVIIFDDVVATGQTVTTIAGKLKNVYPKIKDFWVCTWIMVEPRLGSPSGIEGINQVFSSIVAKGNYTRQPPINSISCFMRNYGKYEDVKQAFIQKYIQNADMFNKTLLELGGGI